MRILCRFCPVIWVFAFFFPLGASALCVTSEVANLRSQPTSKSSITWTVNLYMPLLSVGRKGAWYQVEDVDGAVHWIHQSLVSSKLKCLVVKTTKAALRTGPGTRHEYAQPEFVGKYFSVKRIGFEPPWYQVIDIDGDQFWIHEKLVWSPLRRVKMNF